jgi:predicted nicotinamide N-methyase
MTPTRAVAISSIELNVCGRAWKLARSAALEKLWAQLGEGALDEDERLPYWTELWPASIALCAWLFQMRDAIRGRICVDIGCGLGLTAFVAQWLGARVLAMDYEPEALRYARANAAYNGVVSPLWTVMDWRRPALAPYCARYLWGGDIMYEARFASPVLDFMEHVLAPGGRAWVAEPCRSVYDAFRSLLHSRGWAGRCIYEESVESLYAQAVPVTARVWELARQADIKAFPAWAEKLP